MNFTPGMQSGSYTIWHVRHCFSGPCDKPIHLEGYGFEGAGLAMIPRWQLFQFQGIKANVQHFAGLPPEDFSLKAALN